MKTLGVDLASQPAATGIAVVSWQDGAATIERLELFGNDDRILELADQVDVIGIDAPFGWPVDFTRLVRDEMELETWTDAYRDRLRFRRTDQEVCKVLGRSPLSVSSDRIALAAMRCQHLLRRLNVTDRSGDGRVYEVYPALALHRWGLPSTGYKGRKGTAAREALWNTLATSLPRLSMSDAHTDLMRRSADALDALLSALIARAAAIGSVEPVPDEDRERSRREGWIAIPTAGSLHALHRTD